MENTLLKVSDAVTQEPVVLDVDIRPRNRAQQKLQGWKVLPARRTFIIQPVTLGSLIRISKLLVGIDMKVFDVNNLMGSTYDAIDQYMETAAGIVAIAIQNNRRAPSPKLVQFILNNFTSRELLSVMAVILKQMDVASFMSTIISMKGMSVLESRSANAKTAEISEVSPTDQGR